ncbi:MAG: amino acid ABC transporter permease [Nocardioidaceae bacterium]|nr:amino acid ABC transporter permease [Nocardioidaceae bacterium]MDQ3165296.1 amino acid ABC transporter permease [Actinomycetota bacterium]
MDTLVDNRAEIWEGFRLTLWLLLTSGVLATLLGTVLGSFRVSPVPTLRWIGTSYVNVFRNTPLVIILVMSAAFWPTLGFNDVGFFGYNTFVTFAILGLGLYTAAFVCEAVRSGINSVATGQAEAARSVGMTFAQSLRLVVLPQALRAVIPPLTSIYIALAKNTSITAIVGVPEAAYVMRRLSNKFTSDVYAIFFGIAAGYVVLVLVLSVLLRLAERRLAVAR